MPKNIIYSPLLDSKILQLLRERALKADPDAKLEHIPTNEIQEIIGAIPDDYYNHVLTKGPFLFDSIIGDSNSGKEFQSFKEKNNFSLDIPTPPPSDDFIIFLTAAAVMEFITVWPARNDAKKSEYTIPIEKSFSGKEINVDGFYLDNMEIGVAMIDEEQRAVKARIRLDDDFSVEFCDLSLFKNPENMRNDEADFATLMLSFDAEIQNIYHYKKHYMKCPCVDVLEKVKNHLRGLCYKNVDEIAPDPKLDVVVIDSSETLGKLKLSEKGMEARVETVATAHMLFTASAHSHDNYPPPLIIEKGLVLRLYYKEAVVFVAYVPQENFKTV